MVVVNKRGMCVKPWPWHQIRLNFSFCLSLPLSLSLIRHRDVISSRVLIIWPCSIPLERLELRELDLILTFIMNRLPIIHLLKKLNDNIKSIITISAFRLKYCYTLSRDTCRIRLFLIFIIFYKINF